MGIAAQASCTLFVYTGSFTGLESVGWASSKPWDLSVAAPCPRTGITSAGNYAQSFDVGPEGQTQDAMHT